MANQKILLMAKANKLGIDGYRKMSEDELKSAIARAETGATKSKAPAKGKASTNGKAAPAKGKATPVKGKATPAKGKSAPAKGKASTSKSAPAKSTRQKSAPPKGTAARGAKAKRPTTARGKAVQSGTRQPLGKIKWNVESNVGTTGKRKEVLDALREHKGDKAAAFKSLKRKATKFYPDKDQHAAERMLVWLIGRVAYDYAYKTGQHEPGERAAYGTSKRPQDIKRREARATPRRKPRVATSTRKAAPTKGRATKAAAKRTTGRKVKATAKRGRR